MTEEEKKIEIDTETKTIYVDEDMTPADIEEMLLKLAEKQGWTGISMVDHDPQLIEEETTNEES